LTTKEIPITRMDCPTCVPALEKAVLKLEGVEEARGNYLKKTLRVTYDPGRVQLQDIEAAIEGVGYQIAYKKYPGIVSKIRGLFGAEREGPVETITDPDFPGKVLHSSKPVAVLFSSETCPTCRAFKPRYEELAEKTEERAAFYEMDIASTETWRKYGVMGIPTVIVFREGEPRERFVAVLRKEEIESSLTSNPEKLKI